MISNENFISILRLSIFFLFYSCQPNALYNKKELRHDAEIHSVAGSKIFIDRVANRQILKTDLSDSESTSFCSFKVGFEDSAVYNQKQATEWGIYFNYEMHKNWVLLINGDSIFPVFFQPLIKKTSILYEGIIVFEVAKGSVTDTMIYKNRFDNDTEIFILKK